MHLATLWLSTVLGCGEDPVLTAAKEEASDEQPGQQGPATPDEPPPGTPDEPPPGEGGAPGEIVPRGDVVLITGRIMTEESGEVVLDVFDGDHAAGGANLVGRRKLQPGAYELKVPKDTLVWISAYMDLDADGKPGTDEPKGSAPNPVSTGSGVDGLDIDLK